MKTYQLPVVVEQDEDQWFAYCPPLKEQGGATWGSTRQEALDNIEEVVQMVVESLVAHGDPVPERLNGAESEYGESLVSVTL